MNVNSVKNCSCFYGIICPGCNNKKESKIGSKIGKCAGCEGRGFRLCGKCGYLIKINLNKDS